MSTASIPNLDMLRQQISKFRILLDSFTSSSSSFRVLQSLPVLPAPLPPPNALYILDSSFNPPTLAHKRIALSALKNDAHSSSQHPKRLLLLLATQNADKAPKPASFEQRLLMMQMFAQDLLSTLASSTQNSKSNTNLELDPINQVGVDIAVTKLPYFVDKARAIEKSHMYSSSLPLQVHLTGYDTLIRILDPKYYPPNHTLISLHPFLSKHRLRVTYRTSDSWGEKEAQDNFLKEIQDGVYDEQGMKREWITEERIVMSEGRGEGQEVISSTKVRETVKARNKELLKKLVTDGVAEWILENDLYLEDHD